MKQYRIKLENIADMLPLLDCFTFDIVAWTFSFVRGEGQYIFEFKTELTVPEVAFCLEQSGLLTEELEEV